MPLELAPPNEAAWSIQIWMTPSTTYITQTYRWSSGAIGGMVLNKTKFSGAGFGNNTQRASVKETYEAFQAIWGKRARGGKGKGIRNTKAPAKSDAFRNIRELLEYSSTFEEFVPLLPEEGSDNWQKPVTVSTFETCEGLHSVCRGGVEGDEGGAGSAAGTGAALRTPTEDTSMCGGMGLWGRPSCRGWGCEILGGCRRNSGGMKGGCGRARACTRRKGRGGRLESWGVVLLDNGAPDFFLPLEGGKGVVVHEGLPHPDIILQVEVEVDKKSHSGGKGRRGHAWSHSSDDRFLSDLPLNWGAVTVRTPPLTESAWSASDWAREEEPSWRRDLVDRADRGMCTAQLCHRAVATTLDSGRERGQKSKPRKEWERRRGAWKHQEGRCRGGDIKGGRIYAPKGGPGKAQEVWEGGEGGAEEMLTWKGGRQGWKPTAGHRRQQGLHVQHSCVVAECQADLGSNCRVEEVVASEEGGGREEERPGERPPGMWRVRPEGAGEGSAEGPGKGEAGEKPWNSGGKALCFPLDFLVAGGAARMHMHSATRRMHWRGSPGAVFSAKLAKSARVSAGGESAPAELLQGGYLVVQEQEGYFRWKRTTTDQPKTPHPTLSCLVLECNQDYSGLYSRLDDQMRDFREEQAQLTEHVRRGFGLASPELFPIFWGSKIEAVTQDELDGSRQGEVEIIISSFEIHSSW
ncbi:hypothetical protein DEU56DRAFT_761155 [Suillus clintonianus]|uniref:uncharacterized protein n=1 Tax=Suillus clintonianus TaxID=1904413 RepID=UPI001B85BDB2|nr:uncharacterized protein DEU56DRAFT_761155 [Suillus clintonianus]KAG2118612.1 hypothetical protein DEU56DRAFT_761155 [Suillus clintonianus]